LTGGKLFDEAATNRRFSGALASAETETPDATMKDKMKIAENKRTHRPTGH